MNEIVFEMPVRARYHEMLVKTKYHKRKHKHDYWAALLEPGCFVEVFRIYNSPTWEPFMKRPLRDGERLRLCLVSEEESQCKT